jgi:N-acetylmuramoyl-L-alanine amidase
VRALPIETRTLARLRSTSTIGADTDQVVNARTIIDGTYKWMLLNQTVVEVVGRAQGFTRVRLDRTLDVWVDSDDLVLLPEGTALPRRVTGGFRVTPSAEWVDVAISMGDRPAHLVEPDGRTLVLTLYGVQANPEISPIFGNDTLIRRISWDQVTSDRVRVTLTLSQPVYGWQSVWDESRRAFVLRVRRAPYIDVANPLRGLTIAVDPGHPPAGATGPTGLYEGDAVFPVGEYLAQLLRARGAQVVMTRTSLAPVGLTERGVQARREHAHAFVSVHLNALPDGVNPFAANGTSTLFYHQHSEPLARTVQDQLMKRFGLRDLGVHYQNLAVARPTWFPAVLAEGLFLMIPEQEAAMRDPAFQRRYAEALVVGLERYFVELARR